ncbi:Unc-32p [Gurleya vavrai]
MFRSEDITLIALFLPRDTLKQSINQLGCYSLIQFLNLNSHIKNESLPFTKELRLLEKLKSKIKYLSDEMSDYNLTKHSEPIINIQEDIEKNFDRLVFLKEIRKVTGNKIKNLKEDLILIEALDEYLSSADPECVEECKINLDYVCFILDKQKNLLLERILSQSLRNNVIVHKIYKKNVNSFIIFTHGKNAIERIESVVNGLGGRIVLRKNVNEGSLVLSTHIGQMKRVFYNNEKALEDLGHIINGKLEIYKKAVNKEIRIYETMNKLRFEIGSDCLIAQGWILKKELKTLEKVCAFISKKYGCITFEIIKSSFDLECEIKGISNEEKNRIKNFKRI